jgi:Domain of unknown function (DUF1844)
MVRVAAAHPFLPNASEMTDEKKPFTVTDRRLFTTDGERRESPESETSERESPRPPTPEESPLRAGAPAPQVAGPQGAGGHAVGAVDFTGFLLGLAAQASMLLGAEGQPSDLQGAREMIAILEMLRDKTEGRRTPEEEEVLESILYELRMAYVKMAGGGAA